MSGDSGPADGGLALPTEHLPQGGDFLLLSPSVQPFAYRMVERMFATRTIARGPAVFELPRGQAFSPNYAGGGVRDYIDRNNVAGLLILKRGRIVLEHYALGLDPASRWSSMSMVKSMTAMLVGAAIRDGAIGGVGDGVSDHLPALRGSAFDGVAIRDLITMSSGVRWNEDYTDRDSDVNRYSRSLGEKVPGGVLALMRGLDRAASPGTRFNYNTGDTYVLGCLVSAATGKTLAAYMSEKIWGRFGMEADGFYTLESEGGQEIGGSRAGMVLRDLGRFGQFVLGRGAGVLPEGWVEEAGRAHFTLDPAENSYGAVGYGYSWWIDADGAMVAVGFAGQTLYVNRREDLVIVTLGCWPQPPFDTGYRVDRRGERLAFQAAVVAQLAG